MAKDVRWCIVFFVAFLLCIQEIHADPTNDELKTTLGLSSIPSYCFRPVPPPFVPCKDRTRRYFYDMFSGECKPFYYGACSLGLRNSFLTKEDCLETCKGVKVKREHTFELVIPPPPCKCDERFFRHYEVKGCKPVYNRTDCEHCPTYFDCPETHEDSKVCIHDGVTYEPGQTIDLHPCRKCSCQWQRGGEVGTVVEIVCPITIECPEGFHKPLSKGCYHVYEQGKCCSVETRCVTDETAESGTCEYDGKQYKYGERIYPKEDPCAECICSEKWDGPKGQTCEKIRCAGVEVHKADLLKGCIPIYHEATCCPIEYHCPNTTLGQKTVQQEHDKCYFDGEAYPLRDVLPINHPTGCVTCFCRTPPDFTCVHRRCPPPPEEKEGVICSPTFTPGSCCPTYKCQNDNESHGETKN